MLVHKLAVLYVSCLQRPKFKSVSDLGFSFSCNEYLGAIDVGIDTVGIPSLLS